MNRNSIIAVLLGPSLLSGACNPGAPTDQVATPFAGGSPVPGPAAAAPVHEPASLSAQDLLECLRHDLEDFAGGAAPADDVTMVVGLGSGTTMLVTGGTSPPPASRNRP